MFSRKSCRKQQGNSHPVFALTEWDMRCMALHEAGHAVCSFFLPERENLICITIDPSNEAFGMVRTAPRPHHNETEISLTSTIAVLLAGRLAEDMFMNTKTTSCIHDFAAAQQIATNMVVKFGMGKKSGLAAVLLNPPLRTSESVFESICSDIYDIIIKAESEAEKILTQHEDSVRNLAEKLLHDKTLHQEEIADFFAEQTQ